MTDRTYEVGYGKPPVHTRFAKGQSGCPSGGRKKPKSLSDRLDHILAEKVTVTEGGKTQRMTKEEVFLRQFVARGISGDRQATRLVLEYLTKRRRHTDDNAHGATDDLLMTELLRMMAHDQAGDQHGPV